MKAYRVTLSIIWQFDAMTKVLDKSISGSFSHIKIVSIVYYTLSFHILTILSLIHLSASSLF